MLFRASLDENDGILHDLAGDGGRPICSGIIRGACFNVAPQPRVTAVGFQDLGYAFCFDADFSHLRQFRVIL